MILDKYSGSEFIGQVKYENGEWLTEWVCKKLRKGKDLNLIAEELEEEVNIIESIYETVKNFVPDYDVEAILQSEG